MTTDQANMLLDSYYQARTRRNALLVRDDVSKADRQEAAEDVERARQTLVNYLRQVEFKS